MIDRTQLTEALRELEGLQFEYPEYATVSEAARLLLDFPTDEQVETAERVYVEAGEDIQGMRAALGAVRRSMFGEGT